MRVQEMHGSQVSPLNRPAWALMIFPFLSGALTVGALSHLGNFAEGRDHDADEPFIEELVFTAGVVYYNLLAPFALLVLIAWSAARARLGMPLVLVACAVHLVLTIALLADVLSGESSTGALGFLVFPPLLIIVVALFFVAAGQLHDRRAARSRET